MSRARAGIGDMVRAELIRVVCENIRVVEDEILVGPGVILV